MEVNYRVIWPRGSLNHLAAVWLTTPDRDAVTGASHRIEQQLATDPFACGFARDSSVNRTIVDFPLGIEYEIIEDDK
jgi:hypothetical protein